MAAHYGVAVIPARAYKPRDKATRVSEFRGDLRLPG